MNRFIVVLFVLLLSCDSLYSGEKWHIRVSYNLADSQDRFSSVFLAELKEKLNTSSFFSLDGEKSADIVLQFFAINVKLGGSGISDEQLYAYSVVITLKWSDDIWRYGTTYLGYAGTQKASGAADDFFAATLNWLETYASSYKR